MSERVVILVRDNKRPSQRIAEVYAEAHDIPTEEAEANARLIAAAPELLEACEALISNAIIDGMSARIRDHARQTHTTNPLEIAKAAIARAKGA